MWLNPPEYGQILLWKKRCKKGEKKLKKGVDKGGMIW